MSANRTINTFATSTAMLYTKHTSAVKTDHSAVFRYP